MYDEDKQVRTGYTLTYLVNGKPRCIDIKEKNFYDANEKALNILKNEKALKGKFTKNMNIKLRSNNSKAIYNLEWKKHPPLSGQGGYFTTFKYNSNENNKKVKSNTSFSNTYAIPLFVLVIGVLVFLIEYKNGDAKFAWLLATLVYSAVIPWVRSNLFEKAKIKKNIMLNNILLDSPIWLGTYFTMYAFIKEGIITDTVQYIFLVVSLLFVKLAINYGNERDKSYYDRISS
ncbi:amino acid transporter [Bacillus pseudomycoides]|uniref:amino acid transporter n=2 Tax=Bacillus pseudomycoides TaxID=64104 RepID=UPI000BED97C7|nr:amino acid transporter [Bacillus pseudomycoides]PDZ12697.1 amino acid transporter [Bacillus pseudomycoides]PEP85194.1 amino acid transporter [Bacillus pseudomycoides]PGF05732.1 amino acid transporter [Bacillus pseudomycoides]